MPGFGDSPLGGDGFGASLWSRLVMWDSLPETDRTADATVGGYLRKLVDGVRPSLDVVQGKIKSYGDLRDPRYVPTQYTGLQTLRLGDQVVVLGELEQKALDGVVNSSLEFESSYARFREDDVGHELTIAGSSIETNNVTVRIAQVITTHRVVTDPLLTVDAGPLRWELRPPVEQPDNVITVRVQSGYVLSIAPGWELFDGSSTYTVIARRQFPRYRRAGESQVDRQGTSGVLVAGGLFRTAETTFRPQDIGKKLVLVGGQDSANDGIYEIVGITGSVAPQDVLLDSSADLSADVGPFFWALLQLPELDLQSRVPFRGVAELRGLDAVVVPPATVTMASGTFMQSDIGKFISIRGSAGGYDGLYRIVAVNTPNEIEVDVTWAGLGEPALVWEVRQYTGIGDGVQVEVRPPSLLGYLAQDYGIQIDDRESEAVQRQWVTNAVGWFGDKGSEDGYVYVGKLSGLDVTVSKLYRISWSVYDTMVSLGKLSELIVRGEAEAGRSGTDGRVWSVGTAITFYAETALFKASDIGSHIQISNVATPGNADLILTIQDIVDDHTVIFDTSVLPTLPEYGSGGTYQVPTVRWYILRLYSILPPLLPNYDDFDSDLLHDIIAWKALGTEFVVDKFCWEDDFDALVPVILISSTYSSFGVWDVVVETPPGQPGSADVIVAVGRWRLYDTDGVLFYVETVPVSLGGGQYRFQVRARSAPNAGGILAAYLSYVCEENSSCDFCPSNKIHVSIELGDELDGATPTEIENMLQRAQDRMVQAKSIEAEFVVEYRRPLGVSLGLQVTVEPVIT